MIAGNYRTKRNALCLNPSISGLLSLSRYSQPVETCCLPIGLQKQKDMNESVQNPSSHTRKTHNWFLTACSCEVPPLSKGGQLALQSALQTSTKKQMLFTLALPPLLSPEQRSYCGH